MSRKILTILLIPAILLLGGYLYLRMAIPKTIKRDEAVTGKIEPVDSLGGKNISKADLRPLFIERIQQVLKKSSDGLYNLTVGDLKLDVLASTVSLQNVKVTTDEQRLQALKESGALPANIFHISFASFVIEGINLDDALTQKTMDYKLVRLVNPVIRVYRGKHQPQKKSDEDFSKRFLKEMTKLSIKRLVIEGGTVIAQGSNNKTNKLEGVQVHMNNILLDSSTRTDKQRFLFAEDATISFRNYITQTNDGLYKFRIGKGTIMAPQQQAVLDDLSFTSPLTREQFISRQKVAKEFFSISLSSVTLNKVDWWTLFNGEEVIAQDLLVSSGKLSLYSDRSLPPRSRMGNFPNQLVNKLPLKLNIDKFTIRNIDFSYTEHNPLSKQNGTIYFDDITLRGRNLSTTNTKPLTINASGLFMHQVPITTTLTFDMANPKAGGFSAKISAGKGFEGSLLNAFTMPLGMMKIEKGTLQKLDASIKGDQWKASGNVLLLYKDLKISVLEKERGEKALDKKDVTSLFANLFVIKNDNPKNGREPRRETASFQRDPNSGFFKLIWKTMLVAVLKTIGAPEKIATKKPPEK